ncbi:MAG: hypothetical protein WC058_04710 [Phycisphaeraceae bacterium]
MKHTLTDIQRQLAKIGLLAMLLFFVGCESANTTSSDTTPATGGGDDTRRSVTSGGVGLVPRSRPPITDIPVPVGFKMAESISRDYESSGSRYIDHTYEGYADKIDADRFYAEQMPLKGWTIRGRQMVRGQYILRFEKGSEFCEVRIDSDLTLTGTRTTININVQTLGRGDPRK